MLRPYVTVSYAQSADGRIATSSGMSKWISGEETLEFAHTLRRDNQAILAGIGTVLKDNPMLTCRLPGNEKNNSPVRIIADSGLRIPLKSKIMRTADKYRTVIFCLDTADSSRIKMLSSHGAEVVPVPSDSMGHVDLHILLDNLYRTGIMTLYVEGGSRIITSFFRHCLVDRLYAVCAPIIIGDGIPPAGDLNVKELSDARQGRTVSVKQAGNDIIWEISFPADKSPAEKNKTTAEAVYFTAPCSVKIRREKINQSPGDTLVVSKAICISHGTESLIYRGSFPRGKQEDRLPGIREEMKYPLKYGYMNAGTALGGKKVFAFFPHQDCFYYPVKDLIIFPDTAEFEDIALYPSVETAYNIILDASPLPGERILIIGQGMIGLLAAEILTRITGVHAAALEPDTFRRKLSLNLGITCRSPAGLKGENLDSMVKEMFCGYSPDTVIHVSGRNEGLQCAVDCAAFEGKIIEGSWYGTVPVSLSLGTAFHRRRLRIISSQVSSVPGPLLTRWDKARRTEETKSLIKIINPSKYITHRYRLDRAWDAFKDIDEGLEGMLQAALIPGSAE